MACSNLTQNPSELISKGDKVCDDEKLKQFIDNLKYYAAYIHANLKCKEEFLDCFADLIPKCRILTSTQDETKRRDAFIKGYTTVLENKAAAKEAMYTLLLALVKTEQNDIENLLSTPKTWNSEVYNEPLFDIEPDNVAHYTPEALISYRSKKVYTMTNDRRGFCLIVNIKHFTNENGKVDNDKTRSGSELDVLKLAKVFKGLHFQVRVKVDIGCIEISKEVSQALYDTKEANYGMFVMVIMSHGNRRGILWDKQKEVFNWYDLCRMINDYDALKGKPKVLVVQACAGFRFSVAEAEESDVIAGSSDSSEVSKEVIDDTLIIRSSFEGYESYRKKTKGSHFITALVLTLQRFAGQHHLEDICKMLQNEIREVNKRRSKWNKEKKRIKPLKRIPLPCYHNFLPKMIYLLPGLQDIHKAEKEADDSRELSPDFLQSNLKMKLIQCNENLQYPIHSNDVYKMTDQYRGRCLIISIDTFADNKNRPESEKDAEDLKSVFENLCFYVQLKKNLEGKEIKKELSKELDQQQYGMFVLIIMSRGVKGGDILGSDGIKVDRHKLHLKVCHNKDLKNKPKFFITDVAPVSYEKFMAEMYKTHYAFPKPAIEDVLFLSSCLDDVTRPEAPLKYQNAFIKALIYLLNNHCHEWHLEEICKKLQDQMRMFYRKEKNNAVQIPCYSNFLRKRLFLFPGLKTEELSLVNRGSELETPQDDD